MKKSIIMILFIVTGFALFAREETLFTPEISLGTGISIYDSSKSETQTSILNNSNFKRIIAGFTADTTVNISKPLRLLFGAEVFSDFLWDSDNYYNTTDYSFFTGIKIYPKEQGFNFSIAYALGNRTDFINKDTDTKDWGNGFRLSIQYDFMEDKEYKVRPLAGVYYRCIPRGNYSTDHILCIYGGIRF